MTKTTPICITGERFLGDLAVGRGLVFLVFLTFLAIKKE